MADATPTVPPGKTTSEYALTKAVIVLASFIAALGTIMSVLSAVTAVVPANAGALGKWLAIGGVAVAALKAAAYEIQRAVIKIAAIQAGQDAPSDPAGADAAAANLGK